MENEIIHTAMLGTGKKALDNSSLPPEIAELVDRIQQRQSDAEDLYLQTAALAFNYRQCGVTALPKQNVIIEKALQETLPYCNEQSLRLLQNILDTDSISLLQLWLNACISRQQIVQPDVIPALLETAVKNKALRTIIATCCGNRGLWLSNYNKAWKFGNTATDEEIWQTGTLEQRVQVIKQLRIDNSTLALQWLQQTWPQEDAATKTELLPVLENNISKDDLPFLESLQAEKSKKVKETAAELIRLIPESETVQLYWQVLKETIQLKKEKVLLGLSAKTKLIVQLPQAIDEQVFKSGIDKLSKDAKKWSDDDYIIQQLIRQVSPHFWEEHLAESKENILQYFNTNDKAKKFIPAMGFAAIRFKDAGWLRAIIKGNYDDQIYLSALSILPDGERETYALQLLSKGGDTVHQVVHLLMQYSTKEWSLALTKQALQQMMKNPWHYTKEFFNQHIHLLPASILPELNNEVPEVEYQRSYWNTTIEHITKLLELKQQIQPSFNL